MTGAAMIQDAEGPVLQLSRATKEEALDKLSSQDTPQFTGGVDLSLLKGSIDDDLMKCLLRFCGSLRHNDNGSQLRLANNDIGSGTDCEQGIFDTKFEAAGRQRELKYHQKKKLDSANQKEFSISANMRRNALAGMEEAEKQIKELDERLVELEARKVNAPWYALFVGLEGLNRNPFRRLDLSNCGLHATGIDMLTQTLLEIEHRPDGEKVSWLVLDGNNLGDNCTGFLAAFLRLSSALEVVQLRNIGVTDVGLSTLIAGLVTNKSLKLIDVRSNGLCSQEASKAVADGVTRFNKRVEILLS